MHAHIEILIATQNAIVNIGSQLFLIFVKFVDLLDLTQSDEIQLCLG